MRRFILCVLAIVMIFSFAACAKLFKSDTSGKDNPVGLTEESTLAAMWPDGLGYAAEFLKPPFSGVERVTAGDGFTRVFFAEDSVSEQQLEAYYRQLIDAGLKQATGGLWAGTAYFSDRYAVNVVVLEYVMIDIIDCSAEQFAGENIYFE